MVNYTLKLILIFLFSLFISYASFNGLIVYEALSISLFLTFLLKFSIDLGHSLSIKNIISLIAILQWLVAPIFAYAFAPLIEYNYQMIIPKQEYFSYIFPATFFHLFALYLPIFRNKINLAVVKHVNIDYYKTGIVLVIIGYTSDFLPFSGFLFYLVSSFKYVGAFYIFASSNKRKNIWLIIIFGDLLVIRSFVGAGKFHELLLWGSFLLMFYYLRKKHSFMNKFSIILSGFLVVIIIQIVKPEFRSQVMYKGSVENKYDLFFNLVNNKIFGSEPIFSSDNLANNIIRFNQGWIITHVMDHIPDARPFARGETIKESFLASVFPRFIMPNKPMAGGRENMEKYAGITLGAMTSMDISQIGEAYANFGKSGGIIMMFLLGLFLNYIINFVDRKRHKLPELIFWVPFLFFQVVKAETSLVTILNHLVKASIIVWFFFSPWGQRLKNMVLKKG